MSQYDRPPNQTHPHGPRTNEILNGNSSAEGAPESAEDAAEGTVEALLEFAGSRDDSLSTEDFSLHSDAALLVWKRQLRARRNRRVVGGIALLAAAVLLVFGLRTRMVSVAPPESLVRVVVSVEVAAGDLAVQRGEIWESVLPGETLKMGEKIRTLGGPAQLRVFGASFRISDGTRLSFLDRRQVELEQGRLYVDTGSIEAGNMTGARLAGDPLVGGPLTVHTVYGSVVDIGTQFEVDLQSKDTPFGVRVRSGSIRLTTEESREVLIAGVGEQLRRTESGTFELSPATVHGESWAWTLSTSKPFALDGASLAEYLQWLKSELGWAIQFKSPLAGQEAGSVRLSGSSTAGQLAHETVASVLSSAGFEHELTDGVLLIW